MKNSIIPAEGFSKSLLHTFLLPSIVKSRTFTKFFVSPNSAFTQVKPLAITQTHLAKKGKAATIAIHYSGVPAQAVAAVQYAANVWSTLIASPVPIQLQANWATALAPDVLSEASTQLIRFNVKLPASSTLYTSAYVNKLFGKDLFPKSLDATIDLNSSMPWYFGIDGNTPAGQVDLVTVAMHEMVHAFNTSDSAGYDARTGTGEWGIESAPGFYDRFVVNGLGQSLIDTRNFPNPSIALGAQLTGNNLFFSGKNARAANGGTNPKLYAPPVWDSGSSYIHLDEATYAAGNPDSLITPSLDYAESIHSPGPVGLGILRDMGWIDRRLTGNQRRNTLIGDAGNDTLTGLGSSDRLIGMGGSDTIVGGNGNDLLIGGLGNSGNARAQDMSNNGFDLLIGGRGQDRFALEQGAGFAVISDFHIHDDRLGLARGLSLKKLKFYQNGTYTEIVFHNDLLAELKGVRANQLTAANFTKL